METIDVAQEWRQLSERYAQMEDSELLDLAKQASELTDIAQQALTAALSERGLKLPAPEPPAPAIPEDPDSPYAEDRELVGICMVWSLRDAVQVQTVLDRAGIPFFMGPEKAQCAEAVTSNFAEGVDVNIMRAGLPSWHGVRHCYVPLDDPCEPDGEMNETPVHCPKCHSEEVVFLRLVPSPKTGDTESSPGYKWRCDACGHKWVDDGTVGSL